MAGTVTPGNQRIGIPYDVLWGSTDLGGVDDVKPNLKLIWEALKCGSTGDVKLDDVYRGISDDSHVSVIVREVQLALIRTLMPWAAVSGAFDLTPPIGARMQQYAQQLTLHPRDKGSTTTEDVLFWKAVPVQSFLLPRNGKDPDKWEIIFNVYPDLTKLAAGIASPFAGIKGV